jgi:hypothetical protein
MLVLYSYLSRRLQSTMSSTIYKAQSEHELIEIIEAKGIEHISGKPNCHTLLNLVNQLSNYGLSYLVLPQALYQILTGENIVAPAPYPAVLPYNQNGTQTENNIIHIYWRKNKELKDQMDNCNKALIVLTKSKFEESKYRLQLQNLFTSIPDCTFITFYNRIFDKWGQVNTFDIDTNTERMRKTWDPTTDDMTDLIQQIREGSIFAYYGNFQKQDHELVQIGERLILETGLFGTQFQNWKRRDEAQHTWADFEVFWQAKYDLWAKTSQTAAQHGYGGNVEAPANTNNEVIEAEQAYLQSLQQLAKPTPTTPPPSKISPTPIKIWSTTWQTSSNNSTCSPRPATSVHTPSPWLQSTTVTTTTTVPSTIPTRPQPTK